MVEDLTRARLGRGLAALIGDVDGEPGLGDRQGRTGMRRVPIEFLRRNPHNPRSVFPEAELDELAGSVRERGIIQPIVVRPLRNLPDVFEIVAGERRWRAAQRAGLHEVPVVVVEADDRLALEMAIIENVQRSDLNAMDEAKGYNSLIAQHGYTQSDLATTLGKSRSHIANTLRLLKLPERVRIMIAEGALSAGHGRALLAVENPEAMAARIVERGLNVRDVEHAGRVQDADGEEARPARKSRSRNTGTGTAALEKQLEDVLGLKIRIEDRGGTGELRIRYGSLGQLESLCRALGVAA